MSHVTSPSLGFLTCEQEAGYVRAAREIKYVNAEKAATDWLPWMQTLRLRFRALGVYWRSSQEGLKDQHIQGKGNKQHEAERSWGASQDRQRPQLVLRGALESR